VFSDFFGLFQLVSSNLVSHYGHTCQNYFLLWLNERLRTVTAKGYSEGLQEGWRDWRRQRTSHFVVSGRGQSVVLGLALSVP